MERKGWSATEALREENIDISPKWKYHKNSYEIRPESGLWKSKYIFFGMVCLLWYFIYIQTGGTEFNGNKLHYSAGDRSDPTMSTSIRTCIGRHKDILEIAGTKAMQEKVEESCACRAYTYKKLAESKSCGERTNILEQTKEMEQYRKNYCEDTNIYALLDEKQRKKVFYNACEEEMNFDRKIFDCDCFAKHIEKEYKKWKIAAKTSVTLTLLRDYKSCIK